MIDRCLTPDEFGTALTLPPDSPERRHLDGCPRCRARLLTYREFVEDRSAPRSADLRGAEASLHAAFREAMDAGSAGARRSVVGASRHGFRDRLRRGLRAAVLIPAAAAILISIGTLVGIEIHRGRSGFDQLRGATTGAGTRPAVVLLDPHFPSPGRIDLSWRATPGATSYEIALFGSSLQDLARIDGIADTTRTIRIEELHPAPPSGSVVAWRVTAMRDGATVGESSVSTFRLPR